MLPFPNLAILYGLSDIAGYDGVTPRYVEQLTDATDSVGVYGCGPLRFTADLNSQITDFVNLKYVLLPPGAPSPGPKFTLIYDRLDGRIYRNSRVFPRAFLVARSRTCVDDAAALALVRGGQINLREEVLISECTHELGSGSSPDATPEIERYEPEHVVVHADTRKPAFLVLTGTYDAGWRVSVDGREAPLLRADYAFRAVALGPGSHRVEFLYQPLMVRVGLLLGLVALLGAVALLLIG